MVRPIAVIGFSYSAALLAAFFLGRINLLFLAAIFLALFIICLIVPQLRKTGYLPAVMAAAGAAVLTLFAFNQVYVNNTDILMENEVRIKAVICDLPYERNDRIYYRLETYEIDFPESPQKTKMLVSSPKALRAEPYDTVEATVKVYSNTGSDRYPDIARNIYLRGSLKTYDNCKIIHNEQKPLYYYALMLRKTVIETIRSNFRKEEAGFMTSLLIGDKTAVSYEENTVLRNAGITHIIVASGFHLVVLSGFMTAVFMFLFRCRRDTASGLCVIIVFIYMAAVGFTPSIMRAGIMTIIALTGKMMFRQADSLNSLGAAVLIICFLNPYSVCDTGFLLSVSASAGIILFSDKLTVRAAELLQPERTGMINDKLLKFYTPHENKRRIRILISAVTVPVSALIFTYPITIIFFHFFAPYSVIANLMITFAASLLLSILFILVAADVSVIFRFLKYPLIVISALLAKYILSAAGFIAGLPYAGIRASSSYVPVALALTFAAAFVYYFLKRNQKHNTLAVLLLSAFVFFTFGNTMDVLMKKDSTKLSILDTGKGITAILSNDNESALLYCGGSYDKIAQVTNYLSETSCTDISYMLITDKSAQSAAFAENIMQNYHIQTVQTYDEHNYYERLHRLIGTADNWIDSKSDDNTITEYPCCGTRIFIDKTDKCNAICFYVDNSKYLFCQEGTDCSLLPEDFLKCDYLVASGVIYNSYMIEADSIIISDSPSEIEKDINALQIDDANIYYTAGYGNIGIRIYPDGRTEIGRENDWLN